MDKKTQINGWYIVLAVLAMLAIQQWWIESQQVETIPYSQSRAHSFDRHQTEESRRLR